MIDFSTTIDSIKQLHPKFNEWAQSLPQQIHASFCTKRHGDLKLWLDALNSLPSCDISALCLKEQISIGQRHDVSQQEMASIKSAFTQLIPWRKGPYRLFDDLFIDTEWRSDWKWDRIIPHISPLKNRLVLDVGCGNGYHGLRMAGNDAKYVIGIDPSPRFIVQFYMLKHFIPHVKVDLLPLGIEEVPQNIEAFDTTFSMGVLYHRRSPIDHLRELKNTLRPGGELILETLIVDGEEGYSLTPEGRYAQMGNVWFFPSIKTLTSWLKKCGFDNIRTVDVNQTSLEEQRSTPWMHYQSLKDFLDPNNINLTIEGHPAPKRAVIIANKRKS